MRKMYFGTFGGLFLGPMLLWGAGVAASPPWPDIYGQVGPFDIQTPDEVANVAKAGFSFALLSYPGSDTRKALAENGIKYIDASITGFVGRLCGKSFHETHACPAETANELIKQIKAHLTATATDASIVGYWILDDYPGGDEKPLLRAIHAAIADANRSAQRQRPAICGFAGFLDTKGLPSGHGLRSFDQAVSNFDPQACDMVALYVYGENKTNNPADNDWSMKSLIPYMLSSLRSKGWDQIRQPLIGITQAFGYRHPTQRGYFYTAPRKDDLITQTKALCDAGAIAIISYAWHDSSNDPDAKELYNTPEMVEGLKQGAAYCKSTWSGH